MKLRTRALTLFATTAVLGLGCAPEGASPEAASPQALSWEEFRARVYQEPGTGVFVTNGDETFATEALLREHYETRILAPRGPAQEGLAVMYRNGARARWSDAQKRNITYCVSTAFGSRHAQVVSAMAGAAAEWGASANLRFVHLSGHDGACTASQAGVVFDVNPVNVGGAYLARAFFPDDPRSVRNVLIDNSAFGALPSGLTLQGILRHELGHTLGFRHEHTRPEAGTCFEDNQWQALTSYDRNSTMHYPQCNGNGSWTLALTALDRAGAAALYGAPPRPRPVQDFDGDGRSDKAVYRRPSGEWHILHANGTGAGLQWGLSGDRVVPADYNGDGRTDPAVWRPGNGSWYVFNTVTGTPHFDGAQWGINGDIPVPADYDGDGRADLAVWRPGNGTWHILYSAGGSLQGAYWGLNGDIPVPADHDGDGRTDLAVWRPGNGTWYVLPSTAPGTHVETQWGINGDIPVQADFDGDGRADRAVWRSNGYWYILYSTGGMMNGAQWGLSGDVPVPGDYDGDGRADRAVWRPGNGVWYVLPSSAPGTHTETQWGGQAYGDIAVKVYGQ